tara:strand:- start:10523 stop:11296 length:774 start_codon:yes stop_codon:yes gene_type:complete
MSFIKKDYVKDFIVRLTVSRPEVLNALNIDVIQELDDNLKDCINDDKVGVIILTGEGDKAFIAGADIKKMKMMNRDQAYDFGHKGQNLTKTIETSPKPVIAAVNGFALGGGCEISLACHIRVASDNAKFGQPEVLLGILPGWGGTQRLPRIVGYGIANEIIATGKLFSASEAHRIGLVNHLVSASELILKCEEIAEEILKNGPNAIAQSLLCIRQSMGMDINSGLEFEVDRFSELFDTDEAKEGLSAFVEKRKPKFR